jgi:hypothetical protein
MQPSPPSNFAPAHQFFTQALVALSNPYSSALTDVRNESIASVQLIRQILGESTAERLRQSRETLQNTVQSLKAVNASVEAISNCRIEIQALLNKAPHTAVEPHADIFTPVEDESDKGEDWAAIGSDEEIIDS